MIAANMLLPQLTAAALMNAASGQPGWREGMWVAGSSLFHATLPVINLFKNEQLGQTAMINHTSMTRFLEDFLRELIKIRDAVSGNSYEILEKNLEKAITAREEWLSGRREAQISNEIISSFPSKEEALKRILKLGE